MNSIPVNYFTKTKILCTLGPATSSTEDIKRLINIGCNGVRLNFSHGSYSFYDELFDNIHKARVETASPLAVLVDLQGPKIRIGELEEDEILIEDGKSIEITTENIKGNSRIISCSYKNLHIDAQTGDMILIDDGLISLKVKGKTDKSVICDIISGGIIRPRKGMNLPGMKLSTPSITEKDFRDLEYIIQKRVDYVALSFVRSSQDVLELKKWLKEKGKDISIIAKIEKKEAVDDLDSIINAADGIMIARGDLGVELPPQQVPVIQKKIIKKCNSVGKMVITATQMLESMISNPVPTRAEASDVANAVWDGTEVAMLSGETAVGKFPFRAVKVMHDIILNSENNISVNSIKEYSTPSDPEENQFDSIGKAVVSISKQIKADAIVVFTYKGRTARLISKYRPDSTIIAISDSFETINNLCLRWGIASLFMNDIDKEHVAIDRAKKMILESGHVKNKDILIFTAAAPYSEKSRSNWIKIESV